MIKYEFWSKSEEQDSDINSINYLLGLLNTDLAMITLSDLENITKNSKLLVARTESDGLIVGMATLAVLTIPTGKIGRIEDVVVHDKYRKQGIGKTMVSKLLVEARSLGLKRIDLTSRPHRIAANMMYQKLGFSLVETNTYRLKL